MLKSNNKWWGTNGSAACLLILKWVALFAIKNIRRPTTMVQIVTRSLSSTHSIPFPPPLQVLCSAWKDDGSAVFFGGCDKQAKLWNLGSGAPPQTVAMHDEPIKELAWIPEMNMLATGSWDKTVR